MTVAIEPNIDEDELLERLQKRTIEEVGMVDDGDTLNQEVIDDCLLQADRKVVQEELKEMKSAEKERMARKLRAVTAVKRVAPKLPKKKKGPMSAAALEVQKMRKSTGDRWWAQRQESRSRGLGDAPRTEGNFDTGSATP